MKSSISPRGTKRKGLVTLLLPLLVLRANQVMAGGLDINLNIEVAPPPQTETVVVEHNAPQPEVVVRTAPPPPQTEVIIERPSDEHIWVAGYWHWQGDHYAWVRGHWILPPQADVEWIPPHHEHREVFIPGHWRHLPPPPVVVTTPAPLATGVLSLGGFTLVVGMQAPVVEVAAPRYETVIVEDEAPPVEIVVMAPPPPPQQEIIIERPSPGHVWIGGYWHWNENRYGWVGGHWARPPVENVVWIAPRVEQRGSQHVFIAGSWRHSNSRIAQQASAAATSHAVAPVAPQHTNAPLAVAAPQPAAPVLQQHTNAPLPLPAAVATQHAASAQAHVLVIHEAPPPLKHETASPRPSPDHIWIAGYWRHDGHAYAWVAGRWEIPPKKGHTWIPHRWEKHGGDWVLIEGRWD